MVRRNLLREITQQVFLRCAVQGQSWLIEQQDDIAVTLFDLGKLDQERSQMKPADRSENGTVTP